MTSRHLLDALLLVESVPRCRMAAECLQQLADEGRISIGELPPPLVAQWCILSQRMTVAPSPRLQELLRLEERLEEGDERLPRLRLDVWEEQVRLAGALVHEAAHSVWEGPAVALDASLDEERAYSAEGEFYAGLLHGQRNPEKAARLAGIIWDTARDANEAGADLPLSTEG